MTQLKYLETELFTATPQKLRFLLIGGAIRFARQAIAHLNKDERAEAAEATARCRRIVAELWSVVRARESEVATSVAELYGYLFLELAQAQLNADAAKLEGVVRVLEEDWDTWRQLCEQMPDAPDPAQRESAAQKEITAEGQAPIATQNWTRKLDAPPPNDQTPNAHATPPATGQRAQSGMSWQA